MPALRHGVLGFRVDGFLERHPEVFPTHIKIDVDGIEAKIVGGALKTLAESQFRSLSIELSEVAQRNGELAATIEGHGFRLAGHATADAPAPAAPRNFVFTR